MDEGQGGSSFGGEIDQAIPRSLSRGMGDERTPGTIELRANDQLATVVLLDQSGLHELAKGNGWLFLSNIQPGFYLARLINPEGQYSEQLFELLPGEPKIIMLDASRLPDTRLFKDVTQQARMITHRDNTIEPSEAMGPTASVHLSTILAQAGGAANEKDTN